MENKSTKRSQEEALASVSNQEPYLPKINKKYEFKRGNSNIFPQNIEERGEALRNIGRRIDSNKLDKPGFRGLSKGKIIREHTTKNTPRSDLLSFTRDLQSALPYAFHPAYKAGDKLKFIQYKESKNPQIKHLPSTRNYLAAETQTADEKQRELKNLIDKGLKGRQLHHAGNVFLIDSEKFNPKIFDPENVKKAISDKDYENEAGEKFKTYNLPDDPANAYDFSSPDQIEKHKKFLYPEEFDPSNETHSNEFDQFRKNALRDKDVLFDLENIKSHPKTKKAFNSSLYNDLKAQFISRDKFKDDFNKQGGSKRLAALPNFFDTGKDAFIKMQASNRDVFDQDEFPIDDDQKSQMSDIPEFYFDEDYLYGKLGAPQAGSGFLGREEEKKDDSFELPVGWRDGIVRKSKIKEGIDPEKVKNLYNNIGTGDDDVRRNNFFNKALTEGMLRDVSPSNLVIFLQEELEKGGIEAKEADVFLDKLDGLKKNENLKGNLKKFFIRVAESVQKKHSTQKGINWDSILKAFKENDYAKGGSVDLSSLHTPPSKTSSFQNTIRSLPQHHYAHGGHVSSSVPASKTGSFRKIFG